MICSDISAMDHRSENHSFFYTVPYMSKILFQGLLIHLLRLFYYYYYYLLEFSLQLAMSC